MNRPRLPRIEPDAMSVIEVAALILLLWALVLMWSSHASAQIFDYAIPDGTLIGNNTGTTSVSPIFLTPAQSLVLLGLGNVARLDQVQTFTVSQTISGFLVLGSGVSGASLSTATPSIAGSLCRAADGTFIYKVGVNCF